MNDKTMKKATFSEVCKIMKDNKTDIRECISELFGIALLFFPGLICKDVGIFTNIANGVSLLTAEKEIEKSIKQVYNTFSNKEYVDFSTKYEHAQIAHILIVFAAYFDSIKMYLPNEEKIIRLSDTEKYKLTDEAIKKYREYLEEKLKNKADLRAREVFESDLSIPNPIENIKGYLDRLKEFYDLLNHEFVEFFKKLSFWEGLKENERDAFSGVMRGIPNKAVENYQKQYYELSIKFNDFFVWGNIQEHKEIKQRIDVGFEEISKQIVTYYERFKEEKAKETLVKYERLYLEYINEEIIDTSEMESFSAEDIVFPAKKHIFIPQSFQTLLYKNSMQLEQEVTWKNCKERENIGKFISDTLRHPILGQLPLLILGLPGAGKSLLCNMLAAKILLHEYHVIIIKLRDTVADETISQQISQQMKRDFTNACTWDDIAESGISKPVLLIFDGYDELLQASGRTHSDFIKKISEFQKNQRNIYNIFVRCIVTSRTILIDKALIMDNTPIIKLCDFNEKRIELWGDIWNEKNEYFFKKNELEAFEIDKSSKIYELAKQPLLLLMLALYDSNSNALKKQKNMNSTELYYSLIWEFISREKRKDNIFRSKQENEQQEIIEREVRKLSIAALGMYNRKALYIRSTELQSDIEFIQQKENETDQLKNAELKESDKLLGSFLFVQKLKSTEIVEKGEIKNTAYQFLHNTFGEFLTAYFIVCEISDILDWISLLLKRNMGHQWGLSEQRAWHACLIYAPLFSRPVVINMIHEWSIIYLKQKGMEKEDIKKTMDFFINFEVNSIINGDTIFLLKEIVEKKGNQFRQEEIIKHLAIYSLNIIILATIICTDKYTLIFEKEGVWNKLICIWKYAFTESDFGDFSNIFMVESKENSFLITYNYGENKEVLQQNKISKLFNSYFSIGDELTYSIIGTLVGNDKKDKIIGAINHKQLNINARYMWNYILDNMNKNRISQYHLLDMLYELQKFCWEESDIEYLFLYYLLVDFLLKTKILMYKDERVKRFLLEEVVLGMERFDFYHMPFERKYNFISFIMEISLNILNYIKMDIEDLTRYFIRVPEFRFRRVYSRFDYDGPYNSYYSIRFYNIIIKKLMYCKQGFDKTEMIIREGNFREIIERFIWEQRRTNGRPKIIGEIFELMYNLMLMGESRISEKFFMAYIEVISSWSFYEKNSIAINQKITLIKYIYLIYQKNPIIIHDNLQYIVDILQGITVGKVFEISEEAALHLCCLAEKEEIIERDILYKDLMWIANRKSEYISMAFYKELCRLASKFKWDKLKKVLEEKKS